MIREKLLFLPVFVLLAAAAVAQIQIVYPNTYTEDFESGPSGWTTTMTDWQLGTPSATPLDAAGSGVNAWATVLAGPGTEDGATLVSPVFDFSYACDPVLSFSLARDCQPWEGMLVEYDLGDGMGFRILGSGGPNWYNRILPSNEPVFSGQIPVFQTFSHIVPGAGGRAAVQVRFRSILSGSGLGVVLDDVVLTSAPAFGPDDFLDVANGPASSGLLTGTGVSRAQIVQIQQTGHFSGFEVWFGNGFDSGQVRGELRALDPSGLPDDVAPALYSETRTASPTTRFVNLGAPIPVNAGERYALVITVIAGPLAWSSGQGYTEPSYVKSGGGWMPFSSGVTNSDLSFSTYVSTFLAGTNEDLQLRTLVNGADGGLNEKSATAGDWLTMTMASAGATFHGRAPLLGGSLWTTGAPTPPSVFPGIWVFGPGATAFVVYDGAAGSPLGQGLLGPAPISLNAMIPSALMGSTFRLQALVVTPTASNGIFASSIAHDVTIL